jgi:hypothetical protein
MRFEDDFEDLPRRLHLKGVSPAWRVLGILTSIAAGLFLLLAVAFGVALMTRPNEPAPVQNFGPRGAVVPDQVGAMNPFLNGDDDEEPDNPPYPLVADLQPAVPNGRAEKPKGGDKPTPHDRFVQLGQEIWVSAPDEFLHTVSVAPDGKQLAYMNGPTLMIGTIVGGFQPVIPNNGNIQANHPGGTRRPGTQAVGNVAWSDLSQHIYFADSEGNVNRYAVAARRLSPLPFHGDNPLPMPLDAQKVIFRRSRAVPKVDQASGFPEPDPTEVVLGNIETLQVRVLVPESRETWTPLAVSPDGKWLVLSSNHGADKKKLGHVRLYLLSIAGAAPAEPKPIGPLCPSISSVCWELDSAAFVYARGQEPMPPDCHETEMAGFRTGTDLFRYEVDVGRETRLSRGGGFASPQLDGDGHLLFVTWRFEPGVGRAHLHRTRLSDVLKFAAHEPNLAPRDVAAWTGLFDAVLKETGVAANSRGEHLTTDVLAKLADVFAKQFREQFKTEPPTEDMRWNRLQRELAALDLPPAARRSAALVIGAAEGEHLRRQHKAVWRLSAGPLRRSRAVIGETQEDPFGYVFNPFETAGLGQFADKDDDDEDRQSSGWTEWALHQAHGRTLILTNGPAEDKKGVEQLADLTLARAEELLKQNKGDEADRLLLGMMQQKKHEKNDFLVAHAARLMQEHKRLEAMRQLLEPRAHREPHDPQVHNLFGLALLEADARAAIVQFKTALRCDLHYGTAYLNLAQAYQKANELESAVWCLKRYLKLMPYGPSAQDARQRLAALKKDGLDGER